MTRERKFLRAERVLAGTISVLGMAGLVASRGLGFTTGKGAFLLDVSGDYLWGRQFAFNPLGALLTLLAGLSALAAVQMRRPPVVMGAAALAIALAVVHALDLARGDPALGTRAGNVIVLLALGVGLAMIELGARPPRERDEGEPNGPRPIRSGRPAGSGRTSAADRPRLGAPPSGR